MNILIVLPNDSLGGAEQYLKMIASHYSDENVSIYFFKNNKSKRWDDLKQLTNQHYITTMTEIFGLTAFIFMMLFKRKRYDYIFTSHVYTNALVGILKSLGILRSKYFVARESTSIFLRFNGLMLFIYRALYVIGYRRMDLLICQTELMKSQFLEHFGSIRKRTHIKVIPNPIDLKVSENFAWQDLEPGFSNNFIVTAGRLVKVKGYDLLIEAFSKMKGHHPELKLIILGRGPLQEALELKINALDLAEDVILAGYSDNVYKYFLNARLCVVSSRIEGFPNVLLQMMSQNTKIVSTLCAGGIEDIKGIFTCEPNDVTGLSEALENCLEANTNTNRQLFDDYLNSRSIEKFVKTINESIQ